jgi:hypothetical protein
METPQEVSGAAPVDIGAGAVSFGVQVLDSILSGLFGFVGSLLGGLFGGGSVSPDQLQQAISQLADSMGQALDLVKRFAWAIARMAGAILQAISTILEGILKGLIAAVKALGKLLKDLYNNVLVPLLKGLHDLQKILNDIYRNWLRPIINAIQVVRRLLALLVALHVKWAIALDQRLAQIEGKIAAPFLWLVQQLNGYGQWLNIILTTRATIQRAVFQRSLFENMGTLDNLWWSSQSGGMITPAAAPSFSAPAPTTVQQEAASMQQFAQTGTGDLASAAADSLATIQAMSFTV